MTQKKAIDIAKEALRKCYNHNGIVAGKIHYKNYWARDSFYASWGALELKDYNIVKKNLKLFFKYERKGQIPLKISASSMRGFFAFLGIKSWFRIRYNQVKGMNPAMDPNLLLLITLAKYVEKTKDMKFAKENIEKIKEAILWLEQKEKKGIIYSGKYATWQDSIKKRGFVLYTNVLYYEALKKMSRLFNKLKIKNELDKKAKTIKRIINNRFWDEKKGHYIDYFNENKKSEVFTSDGNFYAIIFDVADKRQRRSILKKAKEDGISKDVPSYPNYPKHKKLEVYPLLYLAHMQSYNDYGMAWTWIGCIHSAALFRAGEKKESKKILDKISKIIKRDNEVYEIYEKNGKPVNRLFYKSEHPFAWSAGFYIMAYKTIFKKLK